MEVGAQACSLRGEMVARGKFGPAAANALSNGGTTRGAVGGRGRPGVAPHGEEVEVGPGPTGRRRSVGNDPTTVLVGGARASSTELGRGEG
jgi:hypothetical protein